jgi:hypothetical protein
MSFIVYGFDKDYSPVAECEYPTKDQAEDAVLRLIGEGSAPDDIRIFAEVKAIIEVTVEF